MLKLLDAPPRNLDGQMDSSPASHLLTGGPRSKSFLSPKADIMVQAPMPRPAASPRSVTNYVDIYYKKQTSFSGLCTYQRMCVHVAQSLWLKARGEGGNAGPHSLMPPSVSPPRINLAKGTYATALKRLPSP